MPSPTASLLQELDADIRVPPGYDTTQLKTRQDLIQQGDRDDSLYLIAREQVGRLAQFMN